jgi:nucleoside-diphosphate-sugar epimerase
LVIGGAGFIGTRLLRALAAGGAAELVSADIASPKHRVAGVQYVHADVQRPLQIEGHFDVVYNLAAVHRTPGHPDKEYFEANVAGAVNVTNYCRANGIEQIVFTSSIAVYGPDESEKTEESLPMPTSSYGHSKLLAEQIHRIWADESPKRRLVVVRPAVVFGRGEQGNFDRLRRLVEGGRFVYPGRRDTIKSCGYVEELVRSMQWVRDLDEPVVTYNFCYPERPTLERIIGAIADLSGSRPPRANLPLAAMLVVAGGFEALGRAGVRTPINRARILKLVRSTNVFPKFLVERGYPFATTLETGVRHWLDEMEGVLDGPAAATLPSAAGLR